MIAHFEPSLIIKFVKSCSIVYLFVIIEVVSGSSPEKKAHGRYCENALCHYELCYGNVISLILDKVARGLHVT